MYFCFQGDDGLPGLPGISGQKGDSVRAEVLYGPPGKCNLECCLLSYVRRVETIHKKQAMK